MSDGINCRLALPEPVPYLARLHDCTRGNAHGRQRTAGPQAPGRQREARGFGARDRAPAARADGAARARRRRSEEHTSELQSLMRISYAVFCLKKKKAIKIVIYILTTII